MCASLHRNQSPEMRKCHVQASLSSLIDDKSIWHRKDPTELIEEALGFEVTTSTAHTHAVASSAQGQLAIKVTVTVYF